MDIIILITVLAFCASVSFIGYLHATRRTPFSDRTGHPIRCNDVLFGITPLGNGADYVWHGVVEKRDGVWFAVGNASLRHTGMFGVVVGNLYRKPKARCPRSNIVKLPKGGFEWKYG